MKICVWDLEAGKKTAEMDGHGGDVVREWQLMLNEPNFFNTKFLFGTFRFQFHFRQTNLLSLLVQLIKLRNFGIFEKVNQSKLSLVIQLT